jgi:hypothetical protein
VELCLADLPNGISRSSALISAVSDDHPTIDDDTNANGVLESIHAAYTDSSTNSNLNNHDLHPTGSALELANPNSDHKRGHHITPMPVTTTTAIGTMGSCLSDTSSCAMLAANLFTAQLDPEVIVKAFRLGAVPVPIQKSALLVVPSPLFLIHDGSGLVSYYDRLSPLDRDVWGIHNPHFVNKVSWPWDGLVSMATEYSSYVLKVTSDPVLIGGDLSIEFRE